MSPFAFTSLFALSLFIVVFVALLRQPSGAPFTRFISPSQSVFFVLVYTLGTFVFDQVMGVTDYGVPPPSQRGGLAIFVGVAVGYLALRVERAVHSRRGRWPRRPLVFVVRAIVMGVVWIGVSAALVPFFGIITSGSDFGPTLLGAVLVMPFYLGFTLIAAVLIGPFVGIINGMMLLLVTQARQTV